VLQDRHLRNAVVAPTETEREIIQLLAWGETHVTLAEKYGSTHHAMSQRIYRMRQFFGVNTSAELVALALKKGWIVHE
jgi:DNA-binding NarL/FixJ family response regulator